MPFGTNVGILNHSKRVRLPRRFEITWVDTPQVPGDVAGTVDRVADDRTQHFIDRMNREKWVMADGTAMETFNSWSRFCESEIEKMFLVAFTELNVRGIGTIMPPPSLWEDDPFAFMTQKMPGFLCDHVPTHGCDLTGLLMQVPIYGYRVDFVLYSVTAYGPDQSKWLFHPLIVECDGHDFHDRTKEQAKRDRKRDRDLAALGCQTIRFTGSELWNDPRDCLNDAFAIIHQQQSHHVSREGGWL